METTLKDYMGELAMGGYTHPRRFNIVKSAILGYERIWELEYSQKGHVNRPSHISKTKKRAEKLVGKSNWFKQRNTENQIDAKSKVKFKNTTRPYKKSKIPPKYESIMFCPFTPFSKLKRELQTIEDKINGPRAVCRVKVIERAGPTIGTLLTNKTPWSKDPCGRTDCHPCRTKPGGCKTPNITYRLECENCKESGVKSHYIGESSRTFFDRAKEHITALRNSNKTYAVVKHWQECHSESKSPPQILFPPSRQAPNSNGTPN